MSHPAEKIHTSVLLHECMNYLAPQSGRVYVDGTMGLGGHTEKILQLSSPEGRVVAFDWDENAIEKAKDRLQPFGNRLQILRRNFAEVSGALDSIGVEQIDGMMIDVGLSSLQLDMGNRGFSFQKDELLDMRMDSRREITAASILHTATKEQLADIFYYYGEERQARPIASAIVSERKINKIESTKHLVGVVARAVPKRFHPKKIHVATRVFQALRVAVNTELENLGKILDEGVKYLKPGARFCVISFHSLEDRIVKRKFRSNDSLTVLTTKPVLPTDEEVAANPRSRSARLRVAEKKQPEKEEKT